MTYFADLSDYAYRSWMPPEGGATWLGNVGWLGQEATFPVRQPSEEFLGALWKYCRYSVNLTRGLHECHLCASTKGNRSERDSEKHMLGSAEIRVFGESGKIYAAPDLIFHYVSFHHYCPPQEFEQAVLYGLDPEGDEYQRRIANIFPHFARKRGVEVWPPAFRFVRTEHGVVREEIPD